MQSRYLFRGALPLALALLGMVSARETAAQLRRGTVPENTVIRVRLDDRLSSESATRGDRFTATLSEDDRSGLPLGTRFEGSVTEVQRSTRDQPGVLDMEFRRAILPDGTTVPVTGDLASLSEDDVRRSTDGRLEARKRSSGKFETKWVGYGAAGGAVLATIFGGGFLKGALLGGLGGAVYGYLNRNRGGARDFSEVEVARGTEFGIRLDRELAFNDLSRYRYASVANPIDDRVERDRVLGRRDEYRFGNTAVRLNGRPVEFTDLRPINLNGVLFVPLRPLARAANMRFDHFAGEDVFTLHTSTGAVRGTAGEFVVTDRDNVRTSLDAAPVSIDGEIFVPTEYLSRVGDMRVDWDRRGRQLTLDTYAPRR